MAFRESALTILGEDAVERYYSWQYFGPHERVAIGAERGSALVGFCFAGKFRGSMSGFLSRNRAFLLWRLIRRPGLLGRHLVRSRIRAVVGLLLRGRKRPMLSGAHRTPDSFGILAIAVDPDEQRTGAGKLMMDFCEEAARAKGACRMHLTVNPQNTRAIRFYERIGWVKEFTEAGWQGRMAKQLRPTQS